MVRMPIMPPDPPRPSRIVVAPFYRRRPVTCALVVVALAVSAVDHVAGRHQADDHSRYHDRIVTVVQVVDGDTFDIDLPDREHPTTRVRLWGVDTPEVEGSRAGAMHFGREASDFAKRMLEGRPVRLELSPTRTRGLYGRLLAYAYLTSDGASFNERLIETGHAYADWRFAHPFKKRYKTLEKRARRRGVGLWAEVRRDDMPAWRRRMEAWSEANRSER